MRLAVLGLLLLIDGPLDGLAADSAATNPWTELARRDLTAAANTLRDQHPGPVDPENPAYAERLRTNLDRAYADADRATNFADYKRTLLAFTNGFRDGHLGIYFTVDSTSLRWPGFLVGRAADGKVRLQAVAESERAYEGFELESCDGATADRLMAERVEPYYWNRDIPQQRDLLLPRLLLSENGDEARRLRSCSLRDRNGRQQTVELRWRYIGRSDADDRRHEAAGLVWPDLATRQIAGTWFISVPSFDFQGPDGTAQIQGFIQDLRQRADELHRSERVVFDLRGNGGGNSGWAVEILRALWGDQWMERTIATFDDTVDWRASQRNLDTLKKRAAEASRAGLEEDADYLRTAVAAVADALKSGKPLARQSIPAKPAKVDASLANPFAGRVYVLTDGICASSCLDFMDGVLKLPGVTHIGLPTSADAIYIDNQGEPLPSGLAALSYSMKVYRNRARGNNQWYEPKIRWPGGPMSDEALGSWVRTLR